MKRTRNRFTGALFLILIVVLFWCYGVHNEVKFNRKYIARVASKIHEEADKLSDHVRVEATYLARYDVLDNVNKISNYVSRKSDASTQELLKPELMHHFFNISHVLPNSCKTDITSLYRKYEVAVNMHNMVLNQMVSLHQDWIRIDRFNLYYSVLDSTVHFGGSYYGQEYKFELFVNEISYGWSENSFFELPYDSVLNMELFKYELDWEKGVIDTSSVRLLYTL